jgi:hypothetical protein
MLDKKGKGNRVILILKHFLKILSMTQAMLTEGGYVDTWIICVAKHLLKLLSLTPRYQTRTELLKVDKC